MDMKFVVDYTIKHTDKTSSLYNLLIDRKVKFNSLQDAIKFVKTIDNKYNDQIKLVGKPSIERAA